MLSSEFYMQLALDAAWKYQGLTYPNPCVGAVVLGPHGEILAIEAHQEAGKPHAEVNALKQAYVNLTHDKTILELSDSFEIHNFLITHHHNCFKECSIFVTLEPCNHVGKTPACAHLIKELALKKCVIAHKDLHVKAAGGIKTLEDAGIEVEVGILEQQAQDLLTPFFKVARKTICFF